MLKRNGKVTAQGKAQEQLSLFDLLYRRESTNPSDPIRIDGRAPLAGGSSDGGEGNGSDGHIAGGIVRGAGNDSGRNGDALPETGDGAEADSAAGARSGLGDDSGEIYSARAGREPEPLNSNNYRIRPEDALGEGSLKQKCRDNFAALELVRKLDSENRAAT